VSPSGKLALDKFTAELSGVEYDHVTIEGHTDRIGTQAYNEKLSLQRADAVKTYLVSRGAVPASKITTVGKGSTQPLTDVGACKGIATSAAVIACLEPDRRVDLDVMGTKPAKK
jgi:OOP family OmpA-OmpF porin